MNKKLTFKEWESEVGFLSIKIARTMKISLFFLFISIGFINAGKSYAQKTEITVTISNKRISDVLDAIEHQTDFTFIYDAMVVNTERKVSVDVKQKNIFDLLGQLFSGTDIAYTVVNKKIILNKEKEINLLQQQGKKKITGNVKDSAGDPIAGATIQIKGVQGGGTASGSNGEFSLNVPENATLIISYVGYNQQTITIGNKTDISVILTEDMQALEEVVVVGYGVQKKESLTSAITSVNTALLEDRSLTKVGTALQGITPGVEIRQSSGRPGYSTNEFNIRGASLGTFSSNNALVLIDGVVAGIDDVNPNDIENISILKDAAAAAIYGSRATGGVVLITTKRGVSGKTTVTYTGTYGAEINPISKYADKVIDTQTWMRANNEGYYNDGSSGIYTDEQIAQYDGSDPLKPASSQWFSWLKKSSPQQTHNVSLRGGNDKISAYASAGFVKQDGLLYNDDYKKVNVQTNVNWKPFSRLEFNFSAFYSKEDITRPIGQAASNLLRPILNPPTDIFRYPNGVYNKGSLDYGGFNAIEAMQKGGNTLYDYDKYRLWGEAKFTIIKGLTLKYTLASNNSFVQGNTYYNLMTRYDSEGNIIGHSTPNGTSYSTASENWNTNRYLSNLVSLDYNKIFGNHTVTAFVGFQTEQNRYDEITARGYKFVNNELREVSASIGSGTDLYGTTKGEEWAMASLIGRATYGYKDRYLAEVTMRYDGSSRFSPDNRWGFFPSASLAWRITQEDFMKNVEWLNNLKLRFSYGELGNQGTALYPYATLVSTGTWVFGDATSTTATVGTPADKNLTWEKKKTVNVGFDFGLLRNRITGSFDWYKDRTKDIIATPTIPSTFGASAPVQNTYTIDNRGWEIELKWSDKIGNVKYYVGVNMSDARDNIVSLGGLGSTDPRYNGGNIVLNSSSGIYYAEGKPRNSLYLFQTDGLFVDQAEIDNYIKPSSLTKPGDIKFIDRNGDGTINSDDRYLSDKTTTPHYIYGINFGTEWNGIDLSVVFNGVGERWAYRNLDGHYMTGNRLHFIMFKSNYDNRWTADNPNKWADQPRLTSNNWISGDYCTMFSQPCEYHLRNMHYIRLKNLQIGYTLPKSITEKIYISKIRIYFTAENLFYIAPGYKENLDPEAYWSTTSDSGAASVYYGPSKVISGGLSVTF